MNIIKTTPNIIHVKEILPGYAREQRICIQPSPSRACRKRRLKKGKGFLAWPRGKESDCNSLRYYMRSQNSRKPLPLPGLKTDPIVHQICHPLDNFPPGYPYSHLYKALGWFKAALDDEADHRSKLPPLSLGDEMSRVGGEARVGDALHLGVGLEPLGEPLGVVARPFHAHVKGAHASQHQGRFERRLERDG